MLGWAWGIKNRTWVALWGLLPIVWLPLAFVLGAKGSEWAWRNRRWDSVEEFSRTQRRWGWYGLIVALLIVLGTVGAALLSSSTSHHTTGQQQTTSVPRNPRVLRRLTRIALRPGDGFRLAHSDVACFLSHQPYSYLDCFTLKSPARRPLGAVPIRADSYGVTIATADVENGVLQAAPRVELDRITRGAFSSYEYSQVHTRNQPSLRGELFIPAPKRLPDDTTVTLGALVPVGGTDLICLAQKTAGVRTVLCGEASSITGPVSNLNPTFRVHSYGVLISNRTAALIRWVDETGGFEVVVQRAEP